MSVDSRSATFDLGRRRQSLSDASELHDAFREQVDDVVSHGLVDLIEQLMERDEVCALDVPMRLLALEREVDAITSSLIRRNQAP